MQLQLFLSTKMGEGIGTIFFTPALSLADSGLLCVHPRWATDNRVSYIRRIEIISGSRSVLGVG